MNFKSCIGVFVGLLAVNVSVQSPTTTMIVKYLNNILNKSSVLLEKANSVVDTVEANEDAIVNNIVALAVDKGKNVNSLILQAIDELREGATDDGKAILDCIEAEKDRTETALSDVLGNIAKCSIPEIPKVLAEIRTILKQFSDLEVFVQGQIDTLENCTKGDYECMGLFLFSWEVNAERIPPVVQSDIKEIVTLIRNIRVCGGNVLTRIKPTAKDIFNDAVVCTKKYFYSIK